MHEFEAKIETPEGVHTKEPLALLEEKLGKLVTDWQALKEEQKPYLDKLDKKEELTGQELTEHTAIILKREEIEAEMGEVEAGKKKLQETLDRKAPMN